MYTVNYITEQGRPFIIVKNEDSAWVADPVTGRVTLTNRRRYGAVIRRRIAEAAGYANTAPSETGPDAATILRDRLVRNGVLNISTLMSVRASSHCMGVIIGDCLIRAFNDTRYDLWYANWSPMTMSTSEAIDRIAKRVRDTEAPTSAYQAVQDVAAILEALHLETPTIYAIPDITYAGWRLSPFRIKITTSHDSLCLRRPRTSPVFLRRDQATETAATMILNRLAEGRMR